MKRYSYLLLVISSFAIVCMLSGCAQTVTPVFQAGKYITIEIDFKANIDTIQNKYYMFFNNNAAPQIPFMPIQMVEPGDIPSQPDVDYYGQYYSTWTNFIVLEGNAFTLVKGPYTSEATPTREVLATWSGADPKQILFTFDISKFGPLTDRLNFDFVTVDKATKLVEDNLSPLNSSPSTNYVYTISNSIASGSDEATPGIRESGDILNWKVMVQ